MALNWTPLTKNPIAVAGDSTGKYIYYIGYDGYTYVSSDWGTTFSVATGVPVTNDFSKLTVSGNGAFVSVVGNNNSVHFLSSDYGITWNNIGGPDSIFCFSFFGLYAYRIDLHTGGIYKTSDYGITWSYLTTAPHASGDYSFIVCDSTGAKVVIANQAGRLWTSSDHGITWAIQSLVTSGIVRSLYCNNTGNNIYVTSSNYLYISTNFGSTFAVALLPVGASPIYTVADDSGRYILFATEYLTNNLFLSSDYGLTFVAQTSPAGSFSPQSALYINSSGTIAYAVAKGALNVLWYGTLRSTDIPVLVSQTLKVINPKSTITNSYKVAIGTTTGTGTTIKNPPHGGTGTLIFGPFTYGPGGTVIINGTDPSGTIILTATVPASAQNTDPTTDTFGVRVNNQYVILTYNGKVITTYLLSPLTFPNLFTSDGWIGWVDGTNTVIDGATPVSVIVPLTGYEYNFNCRQRLGPLGYNNHLWYIASQLRGISVLFMPDGSNYSSEEPSNDDILVANPMYWGGRDYIIKIDAASQLNNAGYGSYLTDVS